MFWHLKSLFLFFLIWFPDTLWFHGFESLTLFYLPLTCLILFIFLSFHLLLLFIFSFIILTKLWSWCVFNFWYVCIRSWVELGFKLSKRLFSHSAHPLYTCNSTLSLKWSVHWYCFSIFFTFFVTVARAFISHFL